MPGSKNDHFLLRQGYLLRAVLLSCLAVVNAWPQAGTSSVRGIVTDSNGAVIPNAEARLTQRSTGTMLETRSNDAGYYLFPGLVLGRYHLRVESPGMAPFEAEFDVQVQQAATVDVRLQVGLITTKVEVHDVTPMINTEAPTLGSTLERRRIEQLPINGRSLTSLLYAVPGVENQRAYALRAGTGGMLVDGADSTDRTWGFWQSRIGLESIEEFKVETNNSSAKTSRPVNLIASSRTGSNQFHGTLFETMRNSAIGTARARQDFYEKPPQLNRHEFGASAGGPVIIPKLYNGTNRTFFFVSYEGLRQVNPTTGSYQVPTEAMRRGDFSDLRDAQGRLITLYDPQTTDTTTWTRQPFAHNGRLNVIDPARMSPFAKFLFDVTPLPNQTGVNPLVGPNLWALVPRFSRANMWTTRIDHKFSDRDRLFGRISQQKTYQRQTINNRGCDVFTVNLCQVLDATDGTNAAFSWTRIFTPTFFMEVLVNGARAPYSRVVGERGEWNSRLGLPDVFQAGLFPLVNSPGLTNYDVLNPSDRYQRQANGVVDVNMTKISGKHELQFGSHVRYEHLNYMPDLAPRGGQMNFSTVATGLYDPSTPRNNPTPAPLTGHNLGNLFLGAANYSATLTRPPFYLTNGEYALYFQDNFKVTPRLTLNLGLRWEFWPEYKQRGGILTSFDTAQRATILGGNLDEWYEKRATLPSVVARLQTLGVKFMSFEEAGVPRSLMNPNWLNFGPRLGFAYKLRSGKSATVLRGGYRISYSTLPVSHWLWNLTTSTPLSAFLSRSVVDATQAPDGITNYGLRSPQTVVAGLNSSDALTINDVGSINRGGPLTRVFDRDQPNTRVQDWNLTLEHEVAPATVARVAYIGNQTSNLPAYYRFNDNTPDYVWFTTTGQALPTGAYANVARRQYDQNVYGEMFQYVRWGRASFNGVQLELERRYARGVGFHVFYLLSNTMGTGAQGVDDSPQLYNTNYYLPGAVPTDPRERLDFLFYQRDASVPKHRLSWNWIADLPFGRGKLLGSGSGKKLDRLIGGWQLAGSGSVRSTYFSLPTNIYPTGQNVEVYGQKYPVEDCRSGQCVPGFLWWNGYIPANRINSYDQNGRPNGVMGVPDNYKPAGAPLIPWGSTALPANAPAGTAVSSFWDTNTVWVPLQNGTIQRLAFNDNMHPWMNQFFPGMPQWDLNASLFKTIAVTESMNLRLNADFFNVLNRPGIPNSIAGDGVLNARTSANTPRQLQFTLRLTW